MRRKPLQTQALLCNQQTVNWSVDTVQELLDQLRTTNVNIGLFHSEREEQKLCVFGVDMCPCPLASNWRHNDAVIAKAEGRKTEYVPFRLRKAKTP